MQSRMFKTKDEIYKENFPDDLYHFLNNNEFLDEQVHHFSGNEKTFDISICLIDLNRDEILQIAATLKIISKQGLFVEERDIVFINKSWYCTNQKNINEDSKVTLRALGNQKQCPWGKLTDEDCLRETPKTVKMCISDLTYCITIDKERQEANKIKEKSTIIEKPKRKCIIS